MIGRTGGTPRNGEVGQVMWFLFAEAVLDTIAASDIDNSDLTHNCKWSQNAWHLSSSTERDMLA